MCDWKFKVSCVGRREMGKTMLNMKKITKGMFIFLRVFVVLIYEYCQDIGMDNAIATSNLQLQVSESTPLTKNSSFISLNVIEFYIIYKYFSLM